MARAERIDLIRKIEDARGSRVLTYICSDRRGAAAQIGDDAVWPMFRQLRRMGKTDKLDLFLYSRGGAVEVPWKITCMLREFCETLSVLIPYRAHSAATMIALGCDKILMGSKAELGAIDPALSRIHQEGDTPIEEQIRVEDVMSFVAFLKEKAGLGDQNALATNVSILSEKLTPQLLGSIYRTHSHIRMVARRLLRKHREAMSDQQINLIIESLAEKTYLHGHAISRDEAKEMGLPVEDAPPEVEDFMWALLEDYAQELRMNQPVDPDAILGKDQDQAEVPVTLAMIESREESAGFSGALAFHRQRQAPPQVNLNINFGVQLPPGIDPKQVPQEVINQILRQVQNDLPRLVQEQLRGQSPPLRIIGRLQGAYWRAPVPADS
jgi:hypothetical protein